MAKKPNIVSLQIVESIGKINIEEAHQMCPTCLAVKKGFASQPYLCPLNVEEEASEGEGALPPLRLPDTHAGWGGWPRPLPGHLCPLLVGSPSSQLLG